MFDLLHGLESIRPEWDSALDVRVVTHLGYLGSGTVRSDLGHAADWLRERRGTLMRSIEWRRRLSLSHVARDGEVLHLTEALGTPLRQRTRWGVTCYDLIPLRMPEQYLNGGGLRFLRRRVEDHLRYHRADRLIAISERTRRDMVDLLGLSPEKITAVPTGIELERWQSPAADDADRRARFDVGTRPYVLFVGEGDPRKGVEPMLRALAEVRRSLDVELVWAGRLPDKHLRRFRERAAAHGVSSAVRFVGFAPDPDLAALYRGAVAHVFLSVLEGFGLTVAEALAAGCPVVVVRDSGCDEVAGEAGHVVAPGDFVAAARAILALATDVEERERRIRAGRARVGRFDRREMARGYVDSWLGMLG